MKRNLIHPTLRTAIYVVLLACPLWGYLALHLAYIYNWWPASVSATFIMFYLVFITTFATDPLDKLQRSTFVKFLIVVLYIAFAMGSICLLDYFFSHPLYPPLF
ncbi:MAG: hypothetical protein ACRCWR_10865 [Saezia sp.]